MHTRLIRVLLLVIAIAIISTGSYFLKQSDTMLVAERISADALRDQARTIGALIAEMRTAEVAYVALGQGQDFWMGRVTSLLPGLQRHMTDFGSKLTAAAAQTAFEPASTAIDDFQKLDSRAQDFVRGGNGLIAADLIFSDGLEATNSAAAQIEAALNEELHAREISVRDQRRQQMTILGGAAGGVLLVMMVLVFTGVASTPAEQSAVPNVDQRDPRDPRELRPQREQRPQPQPVAEFHVTPPNLLNAARVCTDLARVIESKQLPELLERAASILEASGMIVWVVDPSCNSLKPAISVGYADHVVARMGAIHRDSNNAAAAAYRTGEPRTVKGNASGNGALVMPLMTSDGCIGVLSAEMKGGSEKDESSQALAAIFAAQLATLVSAPVTAAPVKFVHYAG